MMPKTVIRSRSKSESNRQCISEKKKDTLRRKLKTAYYEPIKTRGWQHEVVSLQNELIYFRNRIGHHFTEVFTNNINKIWTKHNGSKIIDILFTRKSQRTSQHRNKNSECIYLDYMNPQ